MKIIFMGTPEFSVPSLEALLKTNHDICLVVTQPDRPRGRSKTPVASPVKQAASAHGIPVFQPQKVKAKDAVERLQQEHADLIVVAAFGQILSQEVLDLPRFGCINVHGSLLPKYRGAAPIQWAVIHGEKEAGVTIMKMDAGLDTGDILTQGKMTLAEDETAGSLYEKLSKLGADLLVKTIDPYVKGEIVPTAQNEKESSYAGRLKRELGELNWNQPSYVLECEVRGFNPWPCAYTYWNGKLMKVWMAKAQPLENVAEKIESSDGFEGKEPGTVILGNGNIFVRTQDGFLELIELQLAGKKRMDVSSFLRGSHLKTGDVLGKSPEGTDLQKKSG